MGRQELRTKETRELILRAAKSVIVRKGYEGADINEIAEEANRSKGAMYGHFKSKEDIFFALIQQHRCSYREEMRRLLSRDVEQNLHVMREFVSNLAHDNDWALLELEFKLYTLRHPAAKERFKELYAQSVTDREDIFERLLGPAATEQASIRRALGVSMVPAILAALLLEAEFDSSLLTPDLVQELIVQIFDCFAKHR